MIDVQRMIAWGQEMRAVHRRLQDALDIARDTIEDGWTPTTLARDLQLYCGGFCAALNGHHLGEDTALFPAVLRQRPDLASVVSTLTQDHSMISHLIGEMEHALTEVSADGSDPEALVRHLDGIEVVMQTHFRFEEKKLVALLDEMVIENIDTATVYGPLAG